MQTAAQNSTKAIQSIISDVINGNYSKGYKPQFTIASYYILTHKEGDLFLGESLSNEVRKNYIGRGGRNAKFFANKIKKYFKELGFSCTIAEASVFKITLTNLINQKAVAEFVKDFILDDIDWDSFYPRPMCPEFFVPGEIMPAGGGVFENFTAWAKSVVVENIKEYGITEFDMLTKGQQKGLLAYFKDEYKCYKAENKSIGMPY